MFWDRTPNTAMKLICCLLILVAGCLDGVLSTDFFPCSDYEGAKRMTVKSVEISDCPNGKVCQLVKGEKATVKIEFEAEEEIESLNISIHGVMGGMKLPYPGSYNKNGCDGSGLTCPIPMKQLQEFTLTLPVNKSYPNVPSVDIRIQFEKAGCIRIPAAVVKNRTK